MTKSKQTQYAKSVIAHITSQFPDGAPPHVTRDDASWVNAVKKAVPPPDNIDADTLILDAIDEWFIENGFEVTGVVYVHAERHAAQRAAEQEAALAKRMQEEAPIRAMLREVVVECLLETGLAQMKPRAVVKPHPTKKGPGRGG